MAKNKAKNKPQLVGSQIKPVTLDSTTKLDIDNSKQIVDDILCAVDGSGLNQADIERLTSISNSRDQLYQLIDTMMKDSSVAAIIRTYAEDVCEPSDNGRIMWCESDDPAITKFVNYLLDVMNVDKNIFSWTQSLLQYGDIYLKLFRESDYKDPIFKKESIDNNLWATGGSKQTLNEGLQSNDLNENLYINYHSSDDDYSYYVEMVADPGTMFELRKFGRTYGYVETPNIDNDITSYISTFSGDGINGNNFVGPLNYRMKSSDVNIYQADDYVHACLDDTMSRFPEKIKLYVTEDDFKRDVNSQSYTVRRGKSFLYDSYKIWRQKGLLEDSILLTRVVKSNVVTLVKLEVNDMGKTQSQNALLRVKDKFEQKKAINVDGSMTEYTNPGPVQNYVYITTHGGQGDITVENVGGDVDIKNIADLDYWTNKFFSSYGIPKQFFGWCEDGAGFNGGTSLSIQSSIYAKGVRRVQNAIIQMITDAVSLFLVKKGCKAYINNFKLKMKNPSTQEEIDHRNELSNKINTISNIQSLFADVETRSRKLEIVKSLFAQLNYDGNINTILDKEIAEAITQEEVEKAAAEAEAKADEADAVSEENFSDVEDKTDFSDLSEFADNSEEFVDDADMDLGNSSDVPMESLFTKSDGELLNESQIIEGDDTLPLPEDLNKDFTETY